MNKNKLFLLPTLLIVSIFIVGCGNKNIENNNINNEIVDEHQTALVATDYLLITNKLKASIISAEKKLIIENKTQEILAQPSLYIYEPGNKDKKDISIKASKEIAAGETAEFTMESDESIKEGAFIGLKLGGELHGGFYAASIMSSLPFMFSAPDDPATIRPTSGYWQFTMSGNSGDLAGNDCPNGAAAFSSLGEVKLDVAQDGLSSTMNLDSQNINFYRPDINTTNYESYEYSFNTPTSVGVVSFTFDAVDQEKIQGEIHWDNNEGCSATYPFAMELVQPTEFPPYVPKQGTWNLTYQNQITCGDIVIYPASLYIPVNIGNLNVEGGGPNPMMLNYSMANGSLNLIQQGYTNHYQAAMAMQFLGIYTDPSTGNIYPLSGTYDLWLNSETSATGLLMLFGPENCSVPVPFSLEFIN